MLPDRKKPTLLTLYKSLTAGHFCSTKATCALFRGPRPFDDDTPEANEAAVRKLENARESSESSQRALFFRVSVEVSSLVLVVVTKEDFLCQTFYYCTILERHAESAPREVPVPPFQRLLSLF